MGSGWIYYNEEQNRQHDFIGSRESIPCAGGRIHNETSLGKRRVCDWETTSQLVFHPAVWRRFVVFIIILLEDVQGENVLFVVH